tara:strand:- start:1376 stop:4114 length:2739 start_codon:yes stop_codon:yes gene_type:complete
MLENSLLKTNYLGRDGYIWWIGQIVKQKNWISNIEPYPTENVKDFKGFDYRYKVRIMGYHPADQNELADDQLPWASVSFPVTAGSGQGGASQSPNLRQGMFVHGFFLDGEDGQQPVITGVFGVNQYAEVKRNSDVKDLDPRTTKQILSLGLRGTKADLELLERRRLYQQRTGDLSQGSIRDFQVNSFRRKVDLGTTRREFLDPSAPSEEDIALGKALKESGYGQGKSSTTVTETYTKNGEIVTSRIITDDPEVKNNLRNSSVQPNNIVKSDGQPPKEFEAFSGTDSKEDSIGRYCLPTDRKSANTDEVAIESNISEDQIVSGPDEEADKNDKIPQANIKPKDDDPERATNIQTTLKNALNKKQRLEKSKRKWKEKVSTKIGDILVNPEGELEGLDAIEREIDRTMAQTQERITGFLKTKTDSIQRGITSKINGAMARAFSSVSPSEGMDLKKAKDKANDDLSCAFRNIQANLAKMVGKFLNQAMNKLINAPLCAINNFVGSLLGKISGVIDGAVGAILGPIKSLLSSIGGVNDIIGDLMSVKSSAISFLSCGQTPSSSEVESWNPSEGVIAPLAPKILGTLDIPGILFKAKEVASGVQKSIEQFKNIGSSIKGVVDNADFSDVIGDAIQSCNVGPLRCGPPTIEFFGGGGSGAAGNAIIGAAGTLLGVDILLPGSGYTDIPFVSFKDSCGKGGGASGTAVIEDGKVVNVIMNDTGTGYIPAPDGSQGGDGTTWADPEETTVKRSDGTYDTPYEPGTVITVCPGDEVTEPGGKVILISGEDCTQITAKPPSPPPATPTDPTSNTGEYPIVLSIDSINVADGGFNYDCSSDTVVVEPDNGAHLTIGRCDALGTINQINVINGGSGFKDDPNIYIQSDSGYNCKLVPTFKVTRVEEVSEVPPTGVIQVVDCVGKV